MTNFLAPPCGRNTPTANVFAALQNMFLQGSSKRGSSFSPPEHSRSSRNFHTRSTFSNRGEFVAHKFDRALRQESNLEYKATLSFLACSRVIDILEQPPALAFVDTDGRRFRHTFDLLVTFADGRRFFVYVKPLAKVQQRNLSALVRLMSQQLDRRLAYGILLVTEKDISPVAVFNAELLQTGLISNQPDIENSLDQACAELTGPISIQKLADQCGGTRVAFRSIVKFVATERLVVTSKGKIGLSSTVVASANVEAV